MTDTVGRGVRLVDIGGRRLAARVHGAGPSVVLIMGGGMPGIGAWDSVEDRLAEFATVTSYDRAGLGSSDSLDDAPTTAEMVADLHALLARLPVAPPHVLVGASLGGLIQMLYACEFPAEVAGMVLLDPTPPDQVIARRAKRIQTAAFELLAWSGVFRTAWGLNFLVRRFESSFGRTIDRTKARFLLERYRTRDGWATLRRETARKAESCRQTQAAIDAGRVPDVPTIVVSAGVHPHDERLAEQVRALRRSHERLAASAPRGKLVVAENSTHWVSLDEPDLVIEIVREVLNWGP